jgi:putative ATPase
MDLFNPEEDTTQQPDAATAPLAERMRPNSLDDCVGQDHLVGPDGVLTLQLRQSSVGSMIFWGPPGCGKTTLARITARESGAEFHQISAVSAGVKDVKAIIEVAGYNLKARKKTILFIDEIHRFNKAQQDVLLQSVEEGKLVLIGATTENPSFEVISPLLSRCRTYTLYPLSDHDLHILLESALTSDEIIVNLRPEMPVQVRDSLIALSSSDARIMLNACEAALYLVTPNSNGVRTVEKHHIEHVLQKKTLLYDKQGEYHYDIISAFIKSVRGSDPDAAAYWLVRMLESGEDPKFIARRMIIFASEDIGNADPAALPLVTAAFTAVNYIGMPEAQIILMHAVTYLAAAEKSNTSIRTLSAAKKALKEHPLASVPLHLRNAPTSYMASEGYAAGYKYPHDFPGSFVEQNYLPEELKGIKMYNPGENGVEKSLKERLSRIWKKRSQRSEGDGP